jgi:hypothetical protein
MGWRTRYTALLILLLLVSTFVAASHYHENTADDHDCPICVVSHHQTATSQSTAAFEGGPCFFETTFVPLSLVFSENLFVESLNNRGPPA